MTPTADTPSIWQTVFFSILIFASNLRFNREKAENENQASLAFLKLALGSLCPEEKQKTETLEKSTGLCGWRIQKLKGYNEMTLSDFLAIK